MFQQIDKTIMIGLVTCRPMNQMCKPVGFPRVGKPVPIYIGHRFELRVLRHRYGIQQHVIVAAGSPVGIGPSDPLLQCPVTVHAKDNLVLTGKQVQDGGRRPSLDAVNVDRGAGYETLHIQALLQLARPVQVDRSPIVLSRLEAGPVQAPRYVGNIRFGRSGG